VRAGGVGGGIGLVILLVVVLLGGDPRAILELLGGGGGIPAGSEPGVTGAPDDETGAYLSAVLAMTEDVWHERFAAASRTYREPTLVLFSEAVQSACGFQTAASGPFYCPPDENLYLDTSFFQQLAQMGGPGDFAQAYVVGHEVGHHVQTLLGTSEWVRAAQSQARSQEDANALQVLLELQADCYAGAWAFHANRRERILEPGDLNEGLAAAAAIGDDTILRRSGRAAVPESFTHGSAEQRQEWLGRGLQTGDVLACDTFAAAGLEAPGF
jgi:predicted metalloprotease